MTVRRAETFVQQLEQKCLELGSMPRAFPFVPHRMNKDVRRRVHGNYLIFYRIDADWIDVLHVLHGARDYESWLFDDR
jgi:toxin ParE1/3/4